MVRPHHLNLKLLLVSIPSWLEFDNQHRNLYPSGVNFNQSTSFNIFDNNINNPFPSTNLFHSNDFGIRNLSTDNYNYFENLKENYKV